jgi:hypothetical protein
MTVACICNNNASINNKTMTRLGADGGPEDSIRPPRPSSGLSSALRDITAWFVLRSADRISTAALGAAACRIPSMLYRPLCHRRARRRSPWCRRW